jgi:vanillate monooxygenase ferredoxin subunit
MNEQSIPVTVVRIKRETEHIKSFFLRRTDGAALPGFHAGDHIDVLLPGGITRQYSLCNGPDETEEYQLAIKKEEASRGGSRAMHDVAEGSELRISPPRNNFALSKRGTRHVLLAGGIGVTPILSMAKHLHAEHANFEVHYFTQGPAFTPFLDELSAAKLGPNVALHPGLAAGEVKDTLRQILEQHRGAQLYYCGPLPFMETIKTIAGELSWPADEVHYEHFAPPAAPVGAGFRLELAQSGKSFMVPPEKSILQVLNEHGIKIATSCEQGICGTCVAKVLSGEPEHHDNFLSEFQKKSGKKIILCVSRCKSDTLVIDL